MRQKRLDDLLIEGGFVQNKNEAFVAVTEGRIFVNGQKAISPAQMVGPDAKIEVRGGSEYVGRGAYKLEAALKKFRVLVEGKVCADIGAATGGFTEVLLKHGAKKVYAIDTAKGKLALRIRRDPRVAVMEGVDVRDLKKLPELADLVTIDVSLISLREILEAARRFLRKGSEVVSLFKPQYETRNLKILKHGVIEDSGAREKLLHDFLEWVKVHGWRAEDYAESPIRGGEGNVEYLLWLRSS